MSDATILRSHLRRCLLVFALVTLISSIARAQGGRGPSPVESTKVVKREIAVGQTYVATVMPLKSSAIGSAVDGRVIEFPLDEGARVTKGQVLAQLLTETLSLQKAAAEAELELRRQELTELQNGTRPEEVEQARARMDAAKASLEFSQSRLKRIRELAGRAVTEEQVEEMESATTRAFETFQEAKAAYDLSVAGPRQEKIAQAAARVAVQEEEVKRLQDQINKHTIRSPFDGYIVAEHTEVGQWVKSGELVAEVVALDQVEIRAPVLEAHVPFVITGATARVEIPSLPKELFTGTVSAVVPQGDERSRTFPVTIQVDNPITETGPLLKAGMLARVTLPAGEPQEALLVPKDALVLGGPQPMVYIIDLEPKKPELGKVRPVPVELGVAEGTLIQVKGELGEGEQVVILGNERLMPGQDVMITRESTPNAEAETVPLATRPAQ